VKKPDRRFPFRAQGCERNFVPSGYAPREESRRREVFPGPVQENLIQEKQNFPERKAGASGSAGSFRI
jgi:hypothetical protein